MYDGMATMTYRTTFALDKETRRRLKRLSDQNAVSQAEVVRRAIFQMEKQENIDAQDPVSALKDLYAAGKGIAREEGERYMTEIRASRRNWRGE